MGRGIVNENTSRVRAEWMLKGNRPEIERVGM